MSPPLLNSVIDDLAAEHESLERILRRMRDDQWDADTPAAGWRCRDQVGHLAFFDDMAALAITDPDRFAYEIEEAAPDSERYMVRHLRRGRAMTPRQLLEWWQRARTDLVATLRSRADHLPRRLPWYGPSMGAMSFVSARLMETWAHGQDLVDAVGVERAPTGRLRHVAELGVRTRGFSYRVRGLVPPEEPVEVRLYSDEQEWVWGSSDTDRVTGPIEDFCLVVTQRRHVDDTAVEAIGPSAREWVLIAQAFAGVPGTGRTPGSATAHRSPSWAAEETS